MIGMKTPEQPVSNRNFLAFVVAVFVAIELVLLVMLLTSPQPWARTLAMMTMGFVAVLAWLLA